MSDPTEVGFGRSGRQTRATAPRVGKNGDVYADGFFIHPDASPRDDETTTRDGGSNPTANSSHLRESTKGEEL